MTTNDQTMDDQPMDHVPPESESTDDSKPSELKQNVKRRSTWLRLVFMIVLGFLWGISRFVTAAVVIIQFFYVLLTAETNEQLKTLGHSLAIYSYEITDFLTFNTEVKPFPFDSEWPTELPQAAPPEPDAD
jgi:hypothetical protein